MQIIYKKANTIDQIYCSTTQIQLHSYIYEIIEQTNTAPAIKLKTQAERTPIMSSKQIKKKIESSKFFSGCIIYLNNQIYILCETRSLVHLNKGINAVNIKFGIHYNNKYDLMSLDFNYDNLIEKTCIIREAYTLIDIKSALLQQSVHSGENATIFYLNPNEDLLHHNFFKNSGQMICIYHPKIIDNKYINPIIRTSQLIFNQTGIFDFRKTEKDLILVGCPLFCVSDQSLQLIGFIDKIDDYITYFDIALIKI